jgi:phenylalanyl-tRNA synthetase alpha chain
VAYTVPKLTDFSEAALKQAEDEARSAFDAELIAVSGTADMGEKIELVRVRWLGREKGIVNRQIPDLWLKSAPREAKRDVGQVLNRLKKHVEIHFDPGNVPPIERQPFFLELQSVDITLPGTRRPIGAEHLIIKTMNEIVGVFRNLGYSVEEGPEIETDYYNFEALNFPPNHPARDTQDTLFVANQESKPQRDRLLLRTHTSPVQIRTMQKMKPPVRVVCPGKVHRNDAPDATHSPVFHQVEGLAVDTNITFCDLKGTLDHAMKALFGSSVKTRFYPSFFPFTEPSADVQISCIFCGGKGYRDGGPCRNCKASGWIELLGCGMVDPNVFGFVDYDPKKVSGFAFGMGVERIAILKYGVDDIQLFYNGDIRFLEQFG